MRRLWLIIFSLLYAAAHTTSAQQPPSVPQKCSIEAHRAHLQKLAATVESCISSPSKKLCDPQTVGPDDLVVTTKGDRLVEFQWLRDALTQASADDKGKVKASLAALKEAEIRLRMEQEEDPDKVVIVQHTGEHRELARILSTREFRGLRQRSVWEHLSELIWEWLNNLLGKLSGTGTHAVKYLRGALLALGIAAVTLLSWWFVRAVKRQKLLAVSPEARPRTDSAPSTLSWESHRNEARALAQDGHWREAVHSLYWAAISRMESGGSWPADRTRTPREYVRLLAAGSTRRSDLALMTRNFERIWYGQQTAREEDYIQAETLLERLSTP